MANESFILTNKQYKNLMGMLQSLLAKQDAKTKADQQRDRSIADLSRRLTKLEPKA